MSQESFEPTIIVKLYKICTYVMPIMAKRLPKFYRAFWQKIENTILDAMELVFEANALPKPLQEARLIQALGKCELSRILIRLSFELGLIEGAQYYQITADLREVCKMTQGWIKYIRNGPNPKQEKITFIPPNKF